MIPVIALYTLKGLRLAETSGTMSLRYPSAEYKTANATKKLTPPIIKYKTLDSQWTGSWDIASVDL
jgi:hypothetical protein